VAQYLPDEGHRLSGLFYFGGFTSLPAIPLIVVLLLRKWLPVTFAVSIFVATSLLVFWHHNYNIASDARAAIGLIFIPVYATLITAVVSGFTAVIEFFIRRNRPILQMSEYNNKSEKRKKCRIFNSLKIYSVAGSLLPELPYG
jgi:hypothetical protein